MAIFRAGPWGNLSDSYQPVPTNTAAEGLTLYPVNCAKADWPSQTWAAYYEVETCCTPDTITVEWEYYAFGESALKSYTEQLTRRDGTCDYYRETTISCGGGYGYYYGYSSDTIEYLSVAWQFGFWDITGGTDCFASEVYADTSSNTDECDPVGTYDLYNMGDQPTGYTMTITTP